MMVLAVLAGMLLVAGVVILVAVWQGLLVRRPRTQGSTGLWTTIVDKVHSIPRTTRLLAAVGVLAGLVISGWTGWPVMVVVVPLAFIGVPWLLSSPDQEEIHLLEALDRWVRGMASTLAAGKSITDALRVSARQAPDRLAEPLVLLVRRLDDRWAAPQALLAMADELANPDADTVLASLALATQRGGTGAATTLSALADSIQDRLKALREIEAERAKPRVVVRQVTIITLVVLSVSMVFGRDFFVAYGTPVGQVILTALLAAYVGSLWMLRRMTLPRRRARILRSMA